MKEYHQASECWRDILADINVNRQLLGRIEGFARENNEPTQVVFGTSGWRGEIGTDFTFNNLRIVTEAIIEMCRQNSPAVLDAMGVKDFEEIRRRGAIVGHDNRLLGREFAYEVMGRLQEAGIRVWYAGEAPTPEFSAAVEMMGAACSINLTPSHNPANYAGFKFNPSDGGPAGPEITGKIEEIANSMMSRRMVLGPVLPGKVEEIDTTGLYVSYLRSRGTIDLDLIMDFVRHGDCLVCVDNVYGSSRGRIERILGRSQKMVFLRTESDVLFGGTAPEPSEKNMAGVEAVLRNSSARFKIGAIMDPDGDRIRHADDRMQIPMNYFGAMALHYLNQYKKIGGIVVKSVATSNFVNAIAERLGIPVRETGVGFKNFRPYMLSSAPERAIVAFEESDGISGYNSTLEKDALFGLLLSIEMVAVTSRNLSEYLNDLMNEYGFFYPDRSGIAVDRSLAGDLLRKKLAAIADRCRPGSVTSIGGNDRVVRDVITADGVKVVFDDDSWLMVRPSGTEPKVRFYIEARTEAGKKAIFDAAEKITREALS